MHRNDCPRSDQLYGFRGTSGSHREMVADANEHDVDLVKARQQRHVGKQIRIACVINCRPAANRNDKASRRTAMTQSHAIISRDTGSMMRANERDFYFAIQQRQFAAKMTNRVRLRLLRRITEMFHHRVGQIECCYQFRARLFPDLHRVADVIGMTVRNQDEIDIA